MNAVCHAKAKVETNILVKIEVCSDLENTCNDTNLR